MELYYMCQHYPAISSFPYQGIGPPWLHHPAIHWKGNVLPITTGISPLQATLLLTMIRSTNLLRRTVTAYSMNERLCFNVFERVILSSLIRCLRWVCRSSCLDLMWVLFFSDARWHWPQMARLYEGCSLFQDIQLWSLTWFLPRAGFIGWTVI